MRFRNQAGEYYKQLQLKICNALEELDGGAAFSSDNWEREDSRKVHGGGGDSRVLTEGALFERAGVNFSEVHGTLPAEMSERLLAQKEELPFLATGVSLVLHPRSPMVPTVHANFRYLEVAEASWFGGGADLTPYYLYEEDAEHFHQVFKKACDTFDTSYYPKFKKQCDEYFFLPHRGEARGIGGIFFDYLGRDDAEQLPRYFEFSQAAGESFLDAYLPIAERRRADSWGEEERQFQLLRRGRYVEFNLIHDRGTLFGLKTNGRTESILMSLPPLVRWEYAYEPQPDTREARLMSVLREPRSWT